MALIKSNIFFTSLVILVALFGVCVGGTVHKVGDSKGWSMMGVDYESWASSRIFRAGDSLVFQYNNEFHDVTEVTLDDSEMCDPSKPLAKYQTGSDIISLTKPGLHNFICGAPGHCDMGQKLHIMVHPASHSSSSSPSPSLANAPQYQYGMAPSPLQSGASTSLASWIGLGMVAFMLFLSFA